MLKRSVKSLGDAHGYVSPLLRDWASVLLLDAILGSNSEPAPSIRIRCLGEFLVQRIDCRQTLITGRSKKLAQLLLLLIAAGKDGCPHEVLATALWCGETLPIATQPLRAAVLRLRRWLGCSAAIVVSKGRVALNPDYVSVNSWSFLQEADCLLECLATPFEDRDSGEIALRYERLRIRYLGPLLPEVTDLPAVVSARLEIFETLKKVMFKVGIHWQMARRWKRALSLFEDLQSLDAQKDTVQLELLRCHCALQNYAKMSAVYQQIDERRGSCSSTPIIEAAELLYSRSLSARMPRKGSGRQ